MNKKKFFTFVFIVLAIFGLSAQSFAQSITPEKQKETLKKMKQNGWKVVKMGEDNYYCAKNLFSSKMGGRVITLISFLDSKFYEVEVISNLGTGATEKIMVSIVKDYTRLDYHSCDKKKFEVFEYGKVEYRWINSEYPEEDIREIVEMIREEANKIL